jgi:pyrroloquinoline quinone (PQQ) biosynthesis protein C
MHWLAEMVLDYRKRLSEIEFYQQVKAAKNKSDFAWVRQLLHQSTEFPLLLSLRYSLCKDANYRQYFAVHADEEHGHNEMLKGWMEQHGLMTPGEDVNAVPATVETLACIAYYYRQVLTEDELAQLVGLNAVSEGIASDFFMTIAPIVRQLGMGDEYWDIHAELDVEHSAECLEMFPDVDRESALGNKLAQIVQESFVLNAYMLNSWIGVRATIDLSDKTRELVVA